MKCGSVAREWNVVRSRSLFESIDFGINIKQMTFFLPSVYEFLIGCTRWVTLAAHVKSSGGSWIMLHVWTFSLSFCFLPEGMDGMEVRAESAKRIMGQVIGVGWAYEAIPDCMEAT